MIQPIVRKTAAVIAMGLVGLCSTSASAAVTYTQGHLTAVTDILNSGTLVAANHFGPSASTVVVNGVTFGTSATGLSGMVLSGGDFSSQFGNGTPLDQLMSGLYFQGGGTSSLTLSGLNIGDSYTMQLFLANNINSTGVTSYVSVQGQQYHISNFGSTAEYIRIYFTATSSSQLFNFGNGSGAEQDRMILNAYALAKDGPTVPEPSSLLLAGLGIGFLTRRLRRS